MHVQHSNLSGFTPTVSSWKLHRQLPGCAGSTRHGADTGRSCEAGGCQHTSSRPGSHTPIATLQLLWSRVMLRCTDAEQPQQAHSGKHAKANKLATNLRAQLSNTSKASQHTGFASLCGLWLERGVQGDCSLIRARALRTTCAAADTQRGRNSNGTIPIHPLLGLEIVRQHSSYKLGGTSVTQGVPGVLTCSQHSLDDPSQQRDTHLTAAAWMQPQPV